MFGKSLLNQERLIDDEAIEETLPEVPRYAKPCERVGRFRLEEIVEEAVEKKPERPRTVEVLL